MGKDSHYEATLKERVSIGNRCPLSGVAEEELSHLLIHCSSVWGLWGSLFQLQGSVWAVSFLPSFLYGLGLPLSILLVYFGAAWLPIF